MSSVQSSIITTKMNKKTSLIGIVVIILASLIAFGIYKSHTHHKIQTKKEACFDHFMNYWYSFYEQYDANVELYSRMKKGTILDYIRNRNGRYIYEQVPLYGGGTFLMRQYFNIDQLFSGWWIAHRAVGPIESAPDSRKEERWAYWHIYNCGRHLSRIDDYDENLATDTDYLEYTFNQIDSLSHEIHRGFLMLERYRTSKIRNTDINTLNNISDSEYEFENY